MLVGTAAEALTGADIASRAYDVFVTEHDSYGDYVVDLTQVVKDKAGKEMSRTKCKMYFKQPDLTHIDVLEYSEKGEKKEVPDRKREEDEGDDKFKIKYPFEKEYYRDYAFTYKATETVSAKKCYKVAFTSPKRSEGYVYGSAWIDAGNYKLVKVYAQLYVQPEHVSTSHMTMYFKEFGGRTMVTKVSTYAKATFLLFVNKDIYITSLFSNYKFDEGIPASKFN
jgi:outer membrane lipoprotein-sorting protein